ncbi:MAG: hypothetical protein ACXV2C_00280 [Candidatus Bathyarchaeia archaeon]
MEDKYIKTNVEGLVKDPKSNAILNVDNTALAAYKRQKQFMNRANDTAARLDKVEGDISDIKRMLETLLGKL